MTENPPNPELVVPTESEMPKSTSVAIVAIFTATAVGTSYMLVAIPNVKLFEMIIFLAGLLFGKRIGSLVGFLSGLIYGVFNFYGASPLPLLAVQLVAYTLLGLLGGAMMRSRVRLVITPVSQAVFALIAIGFSLAYALGADYVYALVIGINYLIWILQGAVFTIILVVCNAITFGLLMPLILVKIDPIIEKLYRPPK